jgi:C1A family cysteine protease
MYWIERARTNWIRIHKRGFQVNRLYSMSIAGLLVCAAMLPFGPPKAEVERLVPVAQDVKPEKKVYARGYKPAPAAVSAQAHRVSNAKHAAALHRLPKATQATYDAYLAPGGSCIPPIGDQGSCGDCYLWSGTKAASAAQMVAGIVKPGTGFMLSVQWALDYHPELGGCNGGDEYQVAQVIQTDGCPSVAQYPGAGQNPGKPLPTTGMTLYTISSIVYVDPNQTNQGVASTQSIKNAVLAYGYVSVAVDASGAWWNNATGTTDTGRGTSIDHAIGITAWDDTHDNGDGTKGAWQVDNNWTTGWGNNGRGWIKYGADSVGYEAFVCIATPVIPPPGPGPGPQPPVGGAPVISSPLMASATVGAPFSYQITASNAPTAFAAAGLPDGLACSPLGLVSGTPTGAGTFSVELSATNPMGVGTASLSLTVGTVPIPPGPAGPIKSVVVNFPDGSSQTLYPLTSKTTLEELGRMLQGARDRPTNSEPPLMPAPDQATNKRLETLEREFKDIRDSLKEISKQLGRKSHEL